MCTPGLRWRRIIAVPEDAQPGAYRIVHRGTYKAEADRQIHEFESQSQVFEVR